jgi:hypothetical protein
MRVILMSRPCYRLVHPAVPMTPVEVWRVVLTILPMFVLIIEAVVMHGISARLIHYVIFGRVLLAELRSAHLRRLLLPPPSCCVLVVLGGPFHLALLGFLSGSFLGPLTKHRKMHVVWVLYGSRGIPISCGRVIVV